MTWTWWPWHHPRHSDEAAVELRKLEQLDGEVDRLGAELRHRQRANNFSGMVARAIAKGSRGES